MVVIVVDQSAMVIMEKIEKMMKPSKIIPESRVRELGESLRNQGKTIVFTNGCFDILHVGHVSYLSQAALEGDVLVLGLNSDFSVKRIKGDRRPVNSQHDRAMVLSALACVDYIVVFDAPDPGHLIREIRPHVLVKGADWQEDEIIGADFVRGAGGKVERIRLEPGVSTTGIIEKIVKLFCA